MYIKLTPYLFRVNITNVLPNLPENNQSMAIVPNASKNDGPFQNQHRLFDQIVANNKYLLL